MSRRNKVRWDFVFFWVGVLAGLFLFWYVIIDAIFNR